MIEFSALDLSDYFLFANVNIVIIKESDVTYFTFVSIEVIE